jgi:hypothetical protein
MTSNEAYEERTGRDPETLHVDLPTTPAVQDQLSKLASLLGTSQYLQNIKKFKDGVFAFKLTPDLMGLRTGILDIVS